MIFDSKPKTFEVSSFTILASCLRETESTNALITRRPTKGDIHCDFQGLLTEDNAEFVFVISNLTDGHINFNILKTKVTVNSVDPGPGVGLNEVNELKPRESYVIKTDQETHRTLVLKALKKTNLDFLTVEDDERAAHSSKSAPKGTYYFLSVVPDIADPALAARFAETRWACVDWFYVAEKRQFKLATKYKSRESDRERGTRGGGRGGGGGRGRGGSIATLRKRSVRSTSPAAAANNERARSKSRSPTRSSSSNSDEENGDEENSDEENCDEENGNETPLHPSSFIAKSKAAEVVQGRQVHESSVFTGREYDYSKCSVPCTIGLSVIDNLDLSAFKSRESEMMPSFLEAVAEAIETHIAKENSPLLQKLKETFKEADCVVCLSEEPDCIFYTCGHQCCHFKCVSPAVKDCPLCRQLIVAKIKAAAK